MVIRRLMLKIDGPNMIRAEGKKLARVIGCQRCLRVQLRILLGEWRVGDTHTPRAEYKNKNGKR